MFHFFAFLLVGATVLSAQTRGLGLGGYLQAGNNDEYGGLNAKLWLNSNNAFDLSVSIENDPFGESVGAYASYLYHFWGVIPSSNPKMPLYLGPNGGVGVWDHGYALRFGAVGGIDFCLVPAPIDFYLQLNPALEYSNDDRDGNDAGAVHGKLYLQIGARFFFGG